jgi:hypothetical protein
MLDGGDDGQGTAALRTLCDVDLEHSCEQPDSAHGGGPRGREPNDFSLECLPIDLSDDETAKLLELLDYHTMVRCLQS